MYQQDTILRQIEMLTQALARIFFRKEKVVYEFPEQETGYSDDDVWYARILRLLASSEINAAEDALFDGFDASSVRLRAALDFYSRLNLLSNEALAHANFSREEIAQGLDDIAARCGVEFRDQI